MIFFQISKFVPLVFFILNNIWFLESSNTGQVSNNRGNRSRVKTKMSSIYTWIDSSQIDKSNIPLSSEKEGPSESDVFNESSPVTVEFSEMPWGELKSDNTINEEPNSKEMNYFSSSSSSNSYLGSSACSSSSSTASSSCFSYLENSSPENPLYEKESNHNLKRKRNYTNENSESDSGDDQNCEWEKRGKCRIQENYPLYEHIINDLEPDDLFSSSSNSVELNEELNEKDDNFRLLINGELPYLNQNKTEDRPCAFTPILDSQNKTEKETANSAGNITIIINDINTNNRVENSFNPTSQTISSQTNPNNEIKQISFVCNQTGQLKSCIPVSLEDLPQSTSSFVQSLIGKQQKVQIFKVNPSSSSKGNNGSNNSSSNSFRNTTYDNNAISIHDKNSICSNESSSTNTCTNSSSPSHNDAKKDVQSFNLEDVIDIIKKICDTARIPKFRSIEIEETYRKMVYYLHHYDCSSDVEIFEKCKCTIRKIYNMIDKYNGDFFDEGEELTTSYDVLNSKSLMKMYMIMLMLVTKKGFKEFHISLSKKIKNKQNFIQSRLDEKLYFEDQTYIPRHIEMDKLILDMNKNFKIMKYILQYVLNIKPEKIMEAQLNNCMLDVNTCYFMETIDDVASTSTESNLKDEFDNGLGFNAEQMKEWHQTLQEKHNAMYELAFNIKTTKKDIFKNQIEEQKQSGFMSSIRKFIAELESMQNNILKYIKEKFRDENKFTEFLYFQIGCLFLNRMLHEPHEINEKNLLVKVFNEFIQTMNKFYKKEFLEEFTDKVGKKKKKNYQKKDEDILYLSMHYLQLRMYHFVSNQILFHLYKLEGFYDIFLESVLLTIPRELHLDIFYHSRHIKLLLDDMLGTMNFCIKGTIKLRCLQNIYVLADETTKKIQFINGIIREMKKNWNHVNKARIDMGKAVFQEVVNNFNELFERIKQLDKKSNN